MSDIKVNDFKWEKGKNDLEYIELLKKNIDRMLSQYLHLTSVVKEQYNKGYEQGRADERDRIVKKLEKLDIALVEYSPSGYGEYICKDDVLRIVRGGENE